MNLRLFLEQRLMQLHNMATGNLRYADRPEAFLGEKDIFLEQRSSFQSEMEETRAAIRGIEQWEAEKKQMAELAQGIPICGNRGNVIRLRQKLDDSLTSESPSIAELAQEFHMSRSVMGREFKAMFGQSVYNYYLLKKMELAKELLLQGKGSISQIAHLVGYKVVNSFGIAFKKYHSVSPTTFQKKSKIPESK